LRFSPVHFFEHTEQVVGSNFGVSPKITAKLLVFPPILVSSSERRKKSALYKLRAESNQREINDAAQNDTGCEKKRGEMDFLAGKSASCLTRAQRVLASRSARRGPHARARTTRSLAWPKELN